MTEFVEYKHGMSGRFNQQSMLEQIARNKSNNSGFSFKNECPICKKRRGRYMDHSKCSKILQNQRREQDANL